MTLLIICNVPRLHLLNMNVHLRLIDRSVQLLLRRLFERISGRVIPLHEAG